MLVLQESDVHNPDAANEHCNDLLQAGEELGNAIKDGVADDISQAVIALEASGVGGGSDRWTVAYPVNVEVYITLLLSIFEPPHFGGGPIAEHEEIVRLLCDRCRPALNINTDMMHRLALVRCYFISYVQAAHARADASELNILLKLMEDSVTQFVDEYDPESHTVESAKFEAAVLPDIVCELEDQLSDYHSFFSDIQTESIGEVFSIFAGLKFAHLVGKEAKKAKKDSCSRFIKDSVRMFYRRLADALALEEGMADDEEPAMVTDPIKDLAEFLAEEGLVTVVDMANQFASTLPKAAEASLKELVKCFGNDMQTLFEDNQGLFSSVVAEVYELLHAVHVLIEASAELLGDGPTLDKLHSGLARKFVPLIQNELREQRKRFDDMVNRCMVNEQWIPMNADQCVSGSTVDLFVMVGKTLPLMLGSGLLIDTDIANQYIRECASYCNAVTAFYDYSYRNYVWLVSLCVTGNVDSCVMQYSLFVSKCCGTAPQLNGNEIAATVVDSAEDPLHEQLTTHNLEAMCVRMNSLDFATSKVEDFALQLEPAFGIDPDTASAADRPFAGSIEVAQKCRAEAVDIIGAHIVFRCLQPVYSQLFVPTPQSSRIDSVRS